MSKNFDFLNEDNIERIREEKLAQGLGNLKGSLANLNLKVVKEEQAVEKPEYTPRYSQSQLADLSRKIYREKINPVVEEEKEDKKQVEVADTIASRAHSRALARSLVGLRNGGSDGRLAPLAGPNGGNTGTGACNNYVALTTSMTLEEYEEYVNKKFIKEEEVEETLPQIDTKPEFLQENEAILELENALLAMEDLSWQSIDRVMRDICAREMITPKQLHKDFKNKHGMIPDAWAKEHQMTESVGWFPLDEMVRVNQLGQVYEVTFLFRGGRQRLKFFWPEAGRPSQEDMQKACQKFWPGARLLAFYPSMDPGDNQYNQMVMVPAMTEKYEVVPDDLWDFMSEEDTEIYDEIATEVGEPITPVFLSEEGHYEVTVSDHDTGEEKLVTFGEGSLHDWFGKSKSKDGKPGWVQSDGSPCANEKGETGTPKCYSSQRLAGLKKSAEGKKKIRSADARKSRQDSGQQSKSGAAKPTMVRTFTDPKDYKKHSSGDGKTKSEEYVMEAKDKKGSGSGTKDACYHKVKSRFKVWPSAYGSGALVKCRQAGADNWGKSSKKEEYEPVDECWSTHERVPGTIPGSKGSCRPKTGKEKVRKEEYVQEDDMKGMSVSSGHKRSTESGAGLTAKGAAAYRRKNPGSKLQTAVTTPPSKLKPGSKAAGRRKSFCARSRGWTGERGKAARRRWNC